MPQQAGERLSDDMLAKLAVQRRAADTQHVRGVVEAPLRLRRCSGDGVAFKRGGLEAAGAAWTTEAVI
jgi:hypothetical protein